MKRLLSVGALVLTSASAAAAQPDAKLIVRQSIDHYEKAWRAGMQWGYTQTDVTCADGKTQVATSEILPVQGTPYERLVSKDGKPLSADEQRKEDEKFEKVLRQRREETPEEHTARLQKYEKERAFVKDVPEAYNFKIVGEESVANRPAWIVTLTPRADFTPSTPHGELLKHIDGKLWIDKQDLQWAKAEAHVIDTISIGLILARIGPGAHITLDMSRVADGLWMPREITINGEAKVLLVHTKNLDERLTFTDYRQTSGKMDDRQVAQHKDPAVKSFR